MFGRGRAKRKVQQGLEAAPWQVVVFGRTWMCPFCAELAVEGWPDDDPARVEAALGHLEGCAEWADGEGTERPLTDLRRKALQVETRRRVKQELGRNTSWQLVDASRRWVCPFCGDPTSVVMPSDGRLGARQIEALSQHLVGCYAYKQGRGREKPAATLRSVVQHSKQTEQLVAKVRRKLEGDPAWRRKDGNGRWICAYCLEPQTHIDLSTKLLMFENAPQQIARHLAVACGEFQRGAAPHPLTATQEALQAAGRAVVEAEVVEVEAEVVEVDPAYVEPVPLAPDPPAPHGPGKERPGKERPGKERPGKERPGKGRIAKRTRKRAAKASESGFITLSDSDSEAVALRPRRDPERGTTLASLHESGEFLGVDEPPPESDPAEAWHDELLGALDDSELRRGGARPRRGSARPQPEFDDDDDDFGFALEPDSDEDDPLPPLVDDPPPRSEPAPAPAPAEPPQDPYRSRSSREWRQELQRELATVRSLAPTATAEGLVEADPLVELAASLGLADRGVELLRFERPALTPRGDFVEVLDLGRDRLGLVAGGLASPADDGPLLTAMARSIVQRQAAPDLGPAEVLGRVNAELFEHLGGCFLTMAYALVDLPSMQVRLSRAGLAAPLLVSARRPKTLTPIHADGMILGVDGGDLFTESLEVKGVGLKPGDALLLHTNGLLEIRSPTGQDLGVERLHTLLARYATHEVAYLRDKLDEHLQTHLGATHDPRADISLLALKWLAE